MFGFGKTRIAINGLGRIGKLFLLACMERGVKWDFVINHPEDLDFIVYTLRHDSVHPGPKEKIYHKNGFLYFGKKKVKVYHEREPEKLPWADEGIDLVVECTGLFTERQEAERHLNAGAKRVLISAPAKGHDVTVVYGVNNQMLLNEHKVISAGSCTTNCVSPMLKVLNDSLRVKNAFFTTTHAYTSTQRLIDGSGRKDFRAGRAAAIDIIPSTSGASISVAESIPELAGKIEGFALRVPVVDGSFATVVANVENISASVEDINDLFRTVASEEMKKIMEYNSEPIVSTDVIHNPSSCVFDANFTHAQDGMVSISGWYDNEWGYANRLVDVVKLIEKLK
jgi:glyceraldehyde 3-phosphate dehydrogenase